MGGRRRAGYLLIVKQSHAAFKIERTRGTDSSLISTHAEANPHVISGYVVAAPMLYCPFPALSKFANSR